MDPVTVETLPAQSVHFLDVTESAALEKYGDAGGELRRRTKNAKAAAAAASQATYPSAPRREAVVAQMSAALNQSSIEEHLAVFSAFDTRYHTSATGLQSAAFILDECLSIVAQAGRQADISVEYHRFAASPQPNVIARIAGRSSGDLVILGAHQDSINARGGSPATNRSPGADDDGSGSMTILEVFRALALNGFEPDRTIEFQWYAAEEVGLLGSQAIANEYAADGSTVVHSMMQLDMDGYAPTNPRITLITDYTDPALNQFLRVLVDAYLPIPWENDVCGYGCSDHASFFRAGFPASHPFESTFNPTIHTIDDDLDLIDFAYMMNFARLATAYLVELGLQ